MVDDNIIPETIREKMVKEAKRIENDTFFSAKGHFVASDEWRRRNMVLGIPSTIFSAIAGASALAQFDNHNIVAGVLAIFVAALSALTTFLNPGEKANSHQNAGTRYTAIRNDARKFYDLDSFRDDISDQDLLTLLEDLRKQRNELNQNSLPIPGSAYRKVRQQYSSRRPPTA
ncbi:MAG TPA: SLATT domain-containing protein [Ktedonobacteraceae bacterium]|nr:SLATT domain-containing protein [Ktedonobacteraceae bacterium]